MLCVGDSITNHILQEDLEDTSGFFIDKPTDTLHSATPSQLTNCRLGDALNVISENLTMPPFSSPFPPLPLPDITVGTTQECAPLCLMCEGCPDHY